MAQASTSANTAINPWIIAAAVVVPTFMEVLDTTIANVALRYIAGGISAAEIDAEWVITSYLAANAFVLTISGWLSARLGRRNYFLLSIAIFTMASGLCGMATSLTQIIACRILQGLAGGGLQPSSQAILIDTFPPEKQGTAMSVFGVAALIGPIVGPTLGGLAGRHVQLALDFLRQPARRRLGVRGELLSGSRPGIPHHGTGETSKPTAQLRLHRDRFAGARDLQLGDLAQQGARMGLVRRSVLVGSKR